MLSPRLTNCVECTNITTLLASIECKITEMTKALYNNTVFSLNQPTNGCIITDLLNYKRILIYKCCNSDYACNYTIDMIASKVKLLTGNCKSPCTSTINSTIIDPTI